MKKLIRCNWCGKVTIPETTPPGTYKIPILDDEEYSIICKRCLQWKRDGNKIIITHMAALAEALKEVGGN